MVLGNLLQSARMHVNGSPVHLNVEAMLHRMKSTVEVLMEAVNDTQKDEAKIGDIIHKVDNVKLLDRLQGRKPVLGTLYITTSHLIFMDPACAKERWILHSHISSVEKLPLSSSGSSIKIRCKTFHILTFVIPREKHCLDVMSAISKLSQPDKIEDTHAFTYKMTDGTPRSLGWNFFDLESEFLRMGVPNAHWSLCTLNKDYELCDTYPRYIFLPASANTPMILGSSRFRSRGRLPVLSYLHRDNQASICRCSQPLSGFTARCTEDEQLLQSIFKANSLSTELFVVDTRPRINAMANRAAGKGYENEDNYSNIRFQFVGIENIHAMRTSLHKLVDISDMKNPTMSSFLGALEASSWLKHIRAVVETSVFIAKSVLDGNSVLVHCSDGWDRTAQTCSLAAMMLDPYYRTIQGFQALIEKEWLSFGHKFNDRCRHLSVVDAKEESPVFTQFLDSTWQMMCQFPSAFQFNERFLLILHDHVHSCQFGTFLGNCEKDRLDLRLQERTYSLWGYLASNTADFLNPFYRKEYESEKAVLIPKVYPQNFKYWKGMYNRFETSVHERENISDIISSLADHNASLEDHIQLLEKRVQELAKLLGRPVHAISQKLQGLLSAESLYCLNTLLEKDAGEENSKCDDSSEDRESGFEDGGSSLSKSNMMGDSIIRSDGLDNVTLDQISEEMGSIALNLQSLRNKQQCSCSMPFEHYSKRYHCWKCGNVFCSRCIAKHTPLAGHYSQKPVPVCKTCYKKIKSSKSAISLPAYGEEHTSIQDSSPDGADE